MLRDLFFFDIQIFRRAAVRTTALVFTYSALLCSIFAFFSPSAHAQITNDQLKAIVVELHKEYDAEVAALDAKFFVNDSSSMAGRPDFWWEQEGHRAAHSTWRDKVTGHREFYLFFFGGMGSIEGMTIDAAVMTLCHELGHVLAGPPYKDRHPDDEPMSIEAVADDYAARVCFKRMAKRIAEEPVTEVAASTVVAASGTVSIDASSSGGLAITTAASPRPVDRTLTSAPPSPYVANLCDTRFTTTDDRAYCRRALRAIEFERIYGLEPEINEVSYIELKDPTVVTNVNVARDYYPPTQCRVDTYIAGVLSDERPACWWPQITSDRKY